MNNPNKDHQRLSPTVVPRLSFDQRQLLIAGLLSDQVIFSQARTRLKPEYFTALDEMGLAALWIVALETVDRLGMGVLFDNREVAHTVLETEAKSYFARHSDSQLSQHYPYLFAEGAYLDWLYKKCKPEQFDHKYMQLLLSAFLHERAVNDLWQQVSRDTSGGVVTNVQSVTHKLAELEADFRTIGTDPVESAAPDGWAPPPIKKRPTGIKWLDSFLRGGHAAPETYAVCGAYGSGKTTLGLQLTCSVAEMEMLFANDPVARAAIDLDPDAPYEMGHCYYFYYEMPRDEIRTKLWSCAARIDWDRIKLLGKPGFQLSSTNNLSAEEKAILAIANEQFAGHVHEADFPGEQERLTAAQEKLRTNVWMVDCTGNGASQSVGTGYIPEIANILLAERRKGRKIACVVIDYAQICVERHTSDKDEIYQLLSQFGRRAEHELGVPFDTPVWIFGQLAGAANSRGAASKQHHSDAAGSKRFAENCWFAFNIGTGDERTGCRYFTCSKARRSELGIAPVLKIAGGGQNRSNFNRLIDVSDQCSFDRHGNVVSAAANEEAQLKAAASLNPVNMPATPVAESAPDSPSFNGTSSSAIVNTTSQFNPMEKK